MLALAALAAALALLACQNSESEPVSMGVSPVATVTAAPTATAALPSPTAAPTATAARPSPTANPTPTPAPTPSPTPLAQPSPSPTPAPPAATGSGSVELSPNTVKQGEVFTVNLRRTERPSNATATFAGLRYPMLWTGETWWAVIGVAADLVAGQYPVQVIEDGLINLASEVLAVMDAAFPEELIELAPEQSQLLTDPAAIEEETQLLASTYATVTPERLWSGPFVLPAVGPTGDLFGMRRSFNGGPFSQHTGVDILAGEGQPVAAANSGRVAFAGELHLRGGTVIIDHGAGVFSGYHHLSQMLVVAGQDVTQGEVIGAVGGTGLATAPHLHWEIVVHGVRVDPLPWTQGEIGPVLSLQVAQLVEDEGSRHDGSGLGAQDAPAEGDGAHAQAAGEPNLLEREATLGADEQADGSGGLVRREQIAEGDVPLALPGQDAEAGGGGAGIVERQGR